MLFFYWGSFRVILNTIVDKKDACYHHCYLLWACLSYWGPRQYNQIRKRYERCCIYKAEVKTIIIADDIIVSPELWESIDRLQQKIRSISKLATYTIKTMIAKVLLYADNTSQEIRWKDQFTAVKCPGRHLTRNV